MEKKEEFEKDLKLLTLLIQAYERCPRGEKEMLLEFAEEFKNHFAYVLKKWEPKE